jgi:hypothetical protein
MHDETTGDDAWAWLTRPRTVRVAPDAPSFEIRYMPHADERSPLAMVDVIEVRSVGNRWLSDWKGSYLIPDPECDPSPGIVVEALRALERFVAESNSL